MIAFRVRIDTASKSLPPFYQNVPSAPCWPEEKKKIRSGKWIVCRITRERSSHFIRNRVDD